MHNTAITVTDQDSTPAGYSVTRPLQETKQLTARDIHCRVAVASSLLYNSPIDFLACRIFIAQCRTNGGARDSLRSPISGHFRAEFINRGLRLVLRVAISFAFRGVFRRDCSRPRCTGCEENCYAGGRERKTESAAVADARRLAVWHRARLGGGQVLLRRKKQDDTNPAVDRKRVGAWEQRGGDDVKRRRSAGAASGKNTSFGEGVRGRPDDASTVFNTRYVQLYGLLSLRALQLTRP